MHVTKISLSDNIRKAVIDELEGALAAAIDLKTQTKHAHWNVKGPHFIALHELFDGVATEVEGFSDLIAERIVTLGGTAQGTLGEVGKRTKLSAYPTEISAGHDHVVALSSALAEFGAITRASVDKTAALGDAITADILTEVTRGIDKQLWFVEAHAQK